MTGDPAPVTGGAALVGSAAVALGTLAGLATIGTLLEPGSWWSVSTLAVLLLAAATTVARRTSRSRLAPSAWGVGVATLAVGSLYLGPGTTPSLTLPTPGAFERLGALVVEGVTAVNDGRMPLTAPRGLELLVVVGTMAVFLTADLLALGLGRAGMAGLALAGLWIPLAVFERPAPVLMLAVAGIAYLVLLALTRPRTGQRRHVLRRDAPPVLAAAAALTVVAVVAGPAAAMLPLFGSVHLPSTWGQTTVDGPLRLSTDLDMRRSLESRSDRPVLTYVTREPLTTPLRMYTLDEFDGGRWLPVPPNDLLSPARDAVADGDLLWPFGQEAAAPQDPRVVSVQVQNLDQDHLPIPTEPRYVEIDSDWLYDNARDEVVSTGGTTRGQSYVVTLVPRDLSAEVLRTDSPGTRFPADHPALVVPASDHEADIRALAQEVTAGAATSYDQALALQLYLRDPVTFSYDTDLPPAQTSDAVWDFLTQRRGYCVQYATAMVVMARTLGIPARLAVGFLPGILSTEVLGEYVVSGRQAHAWPELYFADAGWVRFEPTPAVQTGSPPVYADPLAGQTAPPEFFPTGTAQVPDSATPTAAGGADTAGSSRWDELRVPALVGAGALLLVLGSLWLVRRRSGVRRVTAEEPDAWWAELRSRLVGYGLTWSDATTPRGAADLVRERIGPDGPHVTEAVNALDHLVAAVETQRYAPAPPTSWAQLPLQEWVTAVEAPIAAAVAARSADQARTSEPAASGRR